jgi:CheY-like chemotaxis protein
MRVVNALLSGFCNKAKHNRHKSLEVNMVKALVVDDDFDNRIILITMLKHLGCTITQAEDGLQGEQVALQEQPDLILLDIMMPQQDGYQTCTNLRTKGFKGQIVMLSSLGQGVVATQALQCGANAYFSKPMTPQILRGCLNRCSA